MKSKLLSLVLFLSTISLVSAGMFTGEIQFDKRKHINSERRLLKSIGYTDNIGTNWFIAKGTITQMSSIPWYLREAFSDYPEIEPYEHIIFFYQHFTSEGSVSESPGATISMLYSALLDTGMKREQANTIIAKLIIAGPIWDWGDEAKANCGNNCVKMDIKYSAFNFQAGSEYSTRLEKVFLEVPSEVTDMTKITELIDYGLSVRTDLDLPTISDYWGEY